MAIVIVRAWGAPDKKIPFIKALRAYCSLGLEDAVKFLEFILEGKHLVLVFPNQTTAASFIAEATPTGAICELNQSDNPPSSAVYSPDQFVIVDTRPE